MTTIKRIEVKTYRERLYCECGGEMLPTGMIYSTMPPQYPHQCQVCGAQAIAPDSFPRVVYDESGDAQE